VRPARSAVAGSAAAQRGSPAEARANGAVKPSAVEGKPAAAAASADTDTGKAGARGEGERRGRGSAERQGGTRDGRAGGGGGGGELRAAHAASIAAHAQLVAEAVALQCGTERDVAEYAAQLQRIMRARAELDARLYDRLVACRAPLTSHP
jgi:hypothetical protein